MNLSWSKPKMGGGVDPRVRFQLQGLARFQSPVVGVNAWRSAIIALPEEKDLIGVLNGALGEYEELNKSLYVPSIYQAQWAHGIVRAQATAFVRPTILNFLGINDLLDAIIAGIGTIGTIVPDEWLNPNFEFPPEPPAKVEVDDDTVIMAVIDNGVAFAHNLFRNGEESRLQQVWIMDAVPVMGGGSEGRTLEKTEIDGLLQLHLHGGLLDDDGFYRDAGLIDFAVPGFKPAAMRTSHGTHVMSLAAGNGESIGERPILCVQLPTIATSDVSGTSLEAKINLALDRVLEVAERFERASDGARPPLVVTLSYGDFAGPHDGTGNIEAFIDRKVHQLPGTRVVLPAGNGNLARCHARIEFAKGDGEHELKWRVQPNDRTYSVVEIRTPARPADEIPGLLSIRVTPPGGVESDPVGGSNGDRQDLFDGDGNWLGVLDFKIPDPQERGLITLCIAPTESLVSPDGLAPAGVWNIRITRGTVIDDEVAHAWIERDETLPGFPRAGRQSRFEDPVYDSERFDPFRKLRTDDPANTTAMVRRASTLSGFATGVERAVVVVGAWNQASDKMSPYSGAGPALKRKNGDLSRPGPDAVAVADDSDVRRGIFGAGSRSGSIVRMSGTSVAVPQVARLIADDMAQGGNGDRIFVSGQANTDDQPAGHTENKPDADRGGGGRLNRRHRIGSRP